MPLRYLLLWLPMTVIGVLNGILRETTYGKRLPELRAHRLSTLIGAVFIGLYVWFVTGRWPLESGAQAAAAGLVWLALTIAFEFLFGRCVDHYPWSRLLRDYNLRAGRVWSLFLLWLALSPYLGFRLHGAP